MKKLFILIALVAFTGTTVVTAVKAMDKDEVTVTDNFDKEVLWTADEGVQPADTTNPECIKKADGEKKCSSDCKKTCCAKKAECKKKAQ